MEPFSFPLNFYVFFGASTGLILVMGLIAALVRFRQHQSEAHAAKLGLDRIRRMSGEEFEHYLAWLFGQMGYQVEMTQERGDFGANLRWGRLLRLSGQVLREHLPAYLARPSDGQEEGHPPLGTGRPRKGNRTSRRQHGTRVQRRTS
jgi:hypothetical protein